MQRFLFVRAVSQRVGRQHFDQSPVSVCQFRYRSDTLRQSPVVFVIAYQQVGKVPPTQHNQICVVSCANLVQHSRRGLSGNG